jgi:hypothetical protein
MPYPSPEASSSDAGLAQRFTANSVSEIQADNTSPHDGFPASLFVAIRVGLPHPHGKSAASFPDAVLLGSISSAWKLSSS